ncbi:MAG: MmgE/PrpD family protein [Desulfomonile tiedjei]|nr:MmgE/PrpD family protein [Desulfomonile tiedjei]
MLSLKLADFIRSMSFSGLGPQTVRMARFALLDWLGSVARGSQEEPARIALSVLIDQGGRPQATILPSGEKTSALNAALCNGIASHIMELDDVHRSSIIHCGAAVIPAALAAAEMTSASGRKLIEALVAGYEVAIRIGEAVTPSHYYFWHNTGTCGTFGACAAAGKLLGLNREQLIWALGSAGTQAAGLWEFLADGAMSKHLHPGKAAQNGLLSALLAAGGFTGATSILEGEKGFCRAMAPEFNLDRITDSLGKAPYKIEDNSFKIHSSCRHTHPAVDIALELASSHKMEPSDITGIEVRTYRTALDITDTPEPQTVYAAKFNLPFCVALALSKKSCGLADFNDDNLRDPEILALSRRVKLVADDELTSAYPGKWAAVMEITTRSGDVLRGRKDFPLGDPENPASDELLTEKFRWLASDSWGDEKAGSLVKAVMELETVEDVALLF